MKKLTIELRKISSKEDVEKASKRLKGRFNRIAALLIATRHMPKPDIGTFPTHAGDELFVELARIYEIPGAREAIEATQCEAVRRLDRPRKTLAR